MKELSKKMIFRKTKIVFNIFILIFFVVIINHCYIIIDNIFHAQPSIYKKYFIKNDDKFILNKVDITDDYPIILYDNLDKWHSIYSIYQNEKLIFKSKYPSVDEQKVIDLVLEAHRQKVYMFFCSFLICIVIRILLSYKIKNLNKNEKKRVTN